MCTQCIINTLVCHVSTVGCKYTVLLSMYTVCHKYTILLCAYIQCEADKPAWLRKCSAHIHCEAYLTEYIQSSLHTPYRMCPNMQLSSVRFRYVHNMWVGFFRWHITWLLQAPAVHLPQVGTLCSASSSPIPFQPSVPPPADTTIQKHLLTYLAQLCHQAKNFIYQDG